MNTTKINQMESVNMLLIMVIVLFSLVSMVSLAVSVTLGLKVTKQSQVIDVLGIRIDGLNKIVYDLEGDVAHLNKNMRHMETMVKSNIYEIEHIKQRINMKDYILDASKHLQLVKKTN